MSRIMMGSNQNTAKKVYSELLDDIDEELGDVISSDSGVHEMLREKMKEEDIGIDYSIDIESLKKELTEKFPDDRELKEDVFGDERFISLIGCFDDRLRIKNRELLKTVKNEEKEVKKYTRTDIILLYTKHFIYAAEEEKSLCGLVSFPELCEYFRSGIGDEEGVDFYLEESRYQKINEKNIFDMLIIFTLFLEMFR